MNQEYFYNLPSLKDKLKPILCKSCKDNDLCVGECKKCLENQAWNSEYITTHAFGVAPYFGEYHDYRHDYFKRTPLHLPNEHPYMYYGMEFEWEFDRSKVSVYRPNGDDPEHDDDNWRINEILDGFTEICPLFVYEFDSSLGNGVEFISRPMSYAFWTHPDTIDMLTKGLNYLKSQGLLSIQPPTNGMHIHMSKKFFKQGGVEENMAYKNMNWLFQKFQTQIELLGGREYTDYCQSAMGKIKYSINNSYFKDRYNAEIETKVVIKKGANVPSGDHSCSVIMSGNTIEARVFKSTIDVEQIMSNLELVRNFAHAVRNGIDENATFNEIVHTKDNIYLDKYMQKVKMTATKQGKAFDLDQKNTDKIEFKFKGTLN